MSKNIREGLVDVQLVEEDGIFYLDVRYEYENENGIYEVRYPRVLLPISCTSLPLVDRIGEYVGCCYYDSLLVDMGFGKLPIREYSDEVRSCSYHYIVNTIQEKTHKMTVAEIEEKLGYKIEIVSEKEK